MNTDLPGTRHGNSLIGTVADWLMNQALGTASLEDLLTECSLRLNAAGVPLWRSLGTHELRGVGQKIEVLPWRMALNDHG